MTQQVFQHKGHESSSVKDTWFPILEKCDVNHGKEIQKNENEIEHHTNFP